MEKCGSEASPERSFSHIDDSCERKIRTIKVIYKKTTKIIFPTLMVLVKLNLEDSWDGLKLNLGPSQN